MGDSSSIVLDGTPGQVGCHCLALGGSIESGQASESED